MLASSSLKCVLAPSHFHSQAENVASPAAKVSPTFGPFELGHPSQLGHIDGTLCARQSRWGKGRVRGQEQAAAKVAQLQQHQLHQLLHPIQIMFHDELGD